MFTVSILQLVSWVLTCASTDQTLERGEKDAGEAGRQADNGYWKKLPEGGRGKCFVVRDTVYGGEGWVVLKLFQAYVTHMRF